MTTQSLPVSTLVDITTAITGGGAMRLAFGRGLLITTDDALSAGGSGKAQLFANINEVTKLFTAGDALDAATVWFSADPRPQGLWIGRWADADVATSLEAGAAPSVGATVAPLDSSNGTFTVNGTTVTTNLSATTTYATIAAAIQTQIVAIGGVFAGATFTFTAGRFLLSLTGANELDPPYFGTAGTGTDISAALGMAMSDSPRYRQGHDEEDVVNAANEMVALATTGSPVVIMLADDAPLTAGTPPIDTRDALGAWVNAGDYMFGLRDDSAQALVTNDVTSKLALAFDANQGKTMAFFDNASAKPEVGGLALLSAQNLNNPRSIITANAKPVPGVLPSNINGTQFAELERKRANVVTRVGGLSSLVGGGTSRAGYWADAVYWLLWMKNESTLAVWNAMRGSRRLTPAIIRDVMTAVLELGVRNGGIQPAGVVEADTKADIVATTGNQEFNGTLTAGYVLWVQRASESTAADRQGRTGRFKAWLAPSPAIHKVLGDIVLVG